MSRTFLTRAVRLLPVALLMLAGVSTSQAHHSFAAQYDNTKPVNMTGALTKLEWTNPHVYIYIDVTDPANPALAATFSNHPGDLDTATPIGNVVVLSCDDKAPVGQATGVVPLHAEPDTAGPVVNMVNPKDGETALALTTRIGLTFNEFVDLSSLWAGSFIVRKAGTTDPLDGY